MHLRQVTLRRGFNEVLRTYDVAGEFRGSAAGQSDREKFFSLNFLNTKTSIQMGSGNVCLRQYKFGWWGGSGSGSSGGGGSGAQQGSLTMSGSGGGSTDPYQEIETALEVGTGRRQPGPSGPANAAAEPDHDDRAGFFFALDRKRCGFTSSPVATGTFGHHDRGQWLHAEQDLTGTLYVKARPSKMRAVEKMLAQVHKVLGKQVYVEAQLIDVQLSDNFEFGVDWTSLRSRLAAGFGSSPMQLGGSSGTLPNAAALATLRGRFPFLQR